MGRGKKLIQEMVKCRKLILCRGISFEVVGMQCHYGGLDLTLV